MSDAYERKLYSLLTLIEDTTHKLLTDDHPLEHRIFQPEGTEEYGRNFGNIIHDMPAVWSGYASRSAIISKLDNLNFEISQDHYNSRQRCGEELAQLIMSAFGKNCKPFESDIIKIINKARRVHYVLKEENQILRKFMAEQMTPSQAYKAANITLFKAKELFTHKGRPSKAFKIKMENKFRNPLLESNKNVES
jgi:hypothetical protein